MSEHTPTPWRLKTGGNIGNAIEADSGNRSHLYDDDGYRTVALYQSCGSNTSYHCQIANSAANGAFIVKAVNSHDALVKALEEIIDVDTLISDGGKVHDHGPCAERAIAALALVGAAPKP